MLSLWEMSDFTPDVTRGTLIRTGIVQGFGLGLPLRPAVDHLLCDAAARVPHAGTALFSLVRNIGSSIGISIVIFLLGRNGQIVHAELTAQ